MDAEVVGADSGPSSMAVLAVVGAVELVAVISLSTTGRPPTTDTICESTLRRTSPLNEPFAEVQALSGFFGLREQALSLLLRWLPAAPSVQPGARFLRSRMRIQPWCSLLNLLLTILGKMTH